MPVHRHNPLTEGYMPLSFLQAPLTLDDLIAAAIRAKEVSPEGGDTMVCWTRDGLTYDPFRDSDLVCEHSPAVFVIKG